MSFKDSLKKLRASKEFKQFKEKNKNAFLFSAFFVLNSALELETRQIDYFLSEKKAATFTISEDEKIELKIDEINPKSALSALDENIKIDVDKLKDIIDKEMKKKALTEFGINKIIIVLQKIQEKQIWNVTCLLSSLKMLRLHVDCFNGKILESKEASVFDFISVKK